MAGLVLDLYAPYPWGCGVVAYPPGCTQSYQATPEKPANCERGDNAGIYAWAFLVGWVWFTFLFLIIAMTMMYWSIREKERNSEKYNFGSHLQQRPSGNPHQPQQQSNNQKPSTDDNETAPDGEIATSTVTTAVSLESVSSYASADTKSRRRSREFAIQAFLYCVFFFLAFIFGSINIMLVNWGPEQPYMPLMVIQSFFGPMLGFFNFLVYVRPRLIAYQRLHPDKSFWSIAYQHLSWSGQRSTRKNETANDSALLHAAENSARGLGSDGSTPDALQEEHYLE